MKVKITKSIDIADKSPSIPIVKVVKGETRDDLTDHVANRLIELDCAIESNKEPDKDQDGDQGNTGAAAEENTEKSGASDDNTSDNSDDNGGQETTTGDQDNTGDAEPTPETLKAELEETALKEMEGPMGSEQKAKAALEAIGKERYGFDVDKRKTVDGIIEAIVEAAFKAE